MHPKFTASAKALGAVSLLLASNAWAAAEGNHAAVSSDGSISPMSLMSAPPQEGFKGKWKQGLPMDLEAEFPAARLSAAEMADFAATYKPKLPPYAVQGQDNNQPESVLNSDRRFRIYPAESGYPYRAVGQLTFTQGGSNYTCSGWLISPDTVATAGHCVHEGGGGTWSTNVRFYPGRNGSSIPFGSCTAKRLNSVTGWTVSGNSEYDYGAVKLNCTVGNTTGWLGRWWTTASQVDLPIVVLGYPGDKPSSTSWGGAGRVAASETRKTRYFIDTAGGQSGAPVVQADGTGPGSCEGHCGIAIHAYGADSGGRNSATRITETVNTNLVTWINTP
jgi:glutamyl endopeptidase